MDYEDIQDIACASFGYITDLRMLVDNINKLENQIKGTGKQTLEIIEQEFSTLREYLIMVLEKRQLELETNIQQAQQESLQPLRACRHVIMEKLREAKKLYNQSKTLLNNYTEYDAPEVMLDTEILGNLPAVPSLLEVPSFSYVHSTGARNKIVDECKNYGYVFKSPPIQITSLVEKPGAIFVKWEETDITDEKFNIIHEYRLEYCSGSMQDSVGVEIPFSQIYHGTNTEFLVKSLRVGQMYTFRVCCKMDGELVEWSPWSVHRVGCTTIEPFTWQPSPNFNLNLDNKLATKVTENYALLTSNGAQLEPGHSAEFTILEVDEVDESQNAIGLYEASDLDSMGNIPNWKSHAFLVYFNGKIVIDGMVKSTQFLPIKKGDKISFTSEDLPGSKIRLYVEIQDKNVTYDWKIVQDKKLYFFLSCVTPNMKILVE